jgi:hypothetical protein
MNGSQSILATDGGVHPPDKLALATADHLVHVNPKAPAEKQVAARKLEIAIAEALTPHHSVVQGDERVALASIGDGHLDTEVDVAAHVDDALVAVVACAKGTPWEAHFQDADVQAVIRQTLGNHFATSKTIERSWHCDHHPESAAARAWKKARHPGAPPDAPDEPPATIASIKPE